MNTAIIAYDLKNVKSEDNSAVKKALISKFANTFTHLDTPNMLSLVPEWVRLRFPDTTIFVDNSTAAVAAIIAEVKQTIETAGAEPDSIFVAYIGEHLLWNADKQQK